MTTSSRSVTCCPSKMKSILIAVALLVAGVSASSDHHRTKVDYSGHLILRVVPETEEQLAFLREMQNGAYNFWSSPSFVGKPVDIRVAPEEYYVTSRTLAAKNINHKIHVTDVGKLIQEEQREILLRRAIHSGKAFDFENYHTYPEITAFLNELASSSSLVSIASIGKTYEGRDIWMAKISTNSNANKPIMYFECAMHAREWATPATCLWSMNELVTKYGTDADITAILDYADWYMTPVSNPDGYEYTWSTDRLWRKNRQPNTGSICTGTDANRNFDANFGGSGASPLPCSDTYHGPSPFSSQEAAAMRDVLAANRGRVVASVSIHSYSQYWMSPYGNNNSLPIDYPEMYRVMDIAVNALTATYGTQFTYGTIANVIYLASGSTADYAYDTEKIIYSYALELRDTGLYGFELPPSLILPTATETFNGLKAMALAIAGKI